MAPQTVPLFCGAKVAAALALSVVKCERFSLYLYCKQGNKDMINYESAVKNLKAAGYRKRNEFDEFLGFKAEDYAKGNEPIITLHIIPSTGAVGEIHITTLASRGKVEIRKINGLKELKDFLNL